MFHILVVDDDKNTRRLIEAVLSRENYTVTTAENGEQALQRLDEQHIDLIVLDIMMPKIDGYELTRQLRAAGNADPDGLGQAAAGGQAPGLSGRDG